MSKNILFIFIVLLSISSCKVEPEQINFGKDQCHFCKMNIVDKQHAAQYVTQKGKQYKFDAIECMVNQIAKTGENDLSILLVADYGKNKMTNALDATYLICDHIKSPMGANLSALSSKIHAINYQEEYKGKLYNWTELKTYLSQK